MNGEQKEYVSDSSGDIKDRPDNNITITGTSTGNTVTIDADKDQTANVTLEMWRSTPARQTGPL